MQGSWGDVDQRYHRYLLPGNNAEAVKWYRMAAEQGFADAQLNLGVMYYLGTGIPANNVIAYMWLSLAKAQGNENAGKALDMVKERMNAAQIGKAQALASEWWEKHN